MIEALNIYAMASAIAGITVGINLLRGANGQSKIIATFMVILLCAFVARSDAEFLGTDWGSTVGEHRDHEQHPCDAGVLCV